MDAGASDLEALRRPVSPKIGELVQGVKNRLVGY